MLCPHVACVCVKKEVPEGLCFEDGGKEHRQSRLFSVRALTSPVVLLYNT